MQKDIGEPEGTTTEWPSGIPRIGLDNSANKKQSRSPLPRELFAQSTVILAVIAISLYVMMSLAYDAFYGALGVDLSDVGLSYSNVLAHSTRFGLLLGGFIIFGLVWGIIYSVIPWILNYLFGKIPLPKASDSDLKIGFLILLRRPVKLNLRGFVLGSLVITTLLAVSLLGLAAVAQANDAASAVKRGLPVAPRGDIFSMLSYHADPVVILPASGEKVSQAIANIRCDPTTGKSPTTSKSPCVDKLLYLGQANGSIVIYNATRQRSIYLPVSSVILHVSNCRTRQSVDADCSHVYR